MRKPFTFFVLLSTLLLVSSALQAEEARGQAAADLPAATLELGTTTADTSTDCPEESSAATAVHFEDFASSLDAKAGAENSAVCQPQCRTIYTCDCNIFGGLRYRQRNQYRECCGVSCSSWQTTSSSCTNYPC